MLGVALAILAAVEDFGLLAQAAIIFLGAALTIRGRLTGVRRVLPARGGFLPPVYDRDTTVDWISQVYVWIVSVAGLIAVVGLMLDRRRRRTG